MHQQGRTDLAHPESRWEIESLHVTGTGSLLL